MKVEKIIEKAADIISETTSALLVIAFSIALLGLWVPPIYYYLHAWFVYWDFPLWK